ncbi:D-aminoacyl-tRNA deacylase [Peredibacter sp. HCB2-198]|uniref:D-aminoacyl-tRNA deacylase n=1 Tax=Peredibacter sp. HCB2-198 TaxID=3383025 RepID=UPI0038B5B756
MKVVVQRVQEASVSVDAEIVGSINSGLLLLVCFEQGDSEDSLLKAVDKISKLRIFDDAEGRMNLDIQAVKGEILSVSQFTLSWDGSGGHRPSFEKSMAPQEARLKYALFNRELRNRGFTVKEGKFGAFMKVSLVNDGPVTFILQF